MSDHVEVLPTTATADNGVLRKRIVEVGSGKGLFLCRYAKMYPEHEIIGLELAKKYAEMSHAKLTKMGHQHACCLAVDACRWMAEQNPDSFDEVHVYFPDPWWKKRHKKRRVLNEGMVKNIERTLKPGGELHFWTDVLEYFESTLELLAEHTKLIGPEFVPETPPENDMDYRTHFERRTRLNQLPVYRSLFRKV
ncbi:MAG: tRNA (guanosine(46)-N7)-methyltransferase TrmB [Planctomycetes bacterium]|nr:tRNA (guanosine(46)-N7)-methyltransferase TrmB [Planctomycetota bacterium]